MIFLMRHRIKITQINKCCTPKLIHSSFFIEISQRQHVTLYCIFLIKEKIFKGLGFKYTPRLYQIKISRILHGTIVFKLLYKHDSKIKLQLFIQVLKRIEITFYKCMDYEK